MGGRYKFVTMRTARLALFDGFTLDCGEKPLDVPKTLQRLVAFLGLWGQTTRAELVGALWPDVDERKAFGRLRTALWRLQQLGAPVVSTQGESLRLHEWVRVDVDELVHSARLGSLDGCVAPRTGRLRELLPGWYDDWVLVERERLRQLYLHTVEGLAADDLRGGRYADALQLTLVALRAEPLRESPHRLLVRIHLAEGNYYEAINTYHAYRQLVGRELGVGPSPTMQQLFAEMMRQQPMAAAG